MKNKYLFFPICLMTCKRCQGITKDGRRCKNKVSCNLNCTKYCWLHSPTYQKINVSCTTKERRRLRSM